MILYTIIFIFGLMVGSFLNAVIYRLKTGESILFERSHCPECGHVLSWHELIPLVSFVVQRGRCLGCRKSISLQYPLVEIATGGIFLLIFLASRGLTQGDNFINFLYLGIIASFLIIIFVYDLKHYIIPDKIIYPAILVSSIWYLVFGMFPDLNAIYSAVGASAFFAIVFFASRGKWIGFGDVKLAFFMGLFLGWPNVAAALFLAFVLGGIMGMGLVAASKKTMQSQVPFGPFLVTGTFLALFWGGGIINWYLGLFI